MYACTCVCMFVGAYVSMCVCMYLCTFVYTCTPVYMYIHRYVRTKIIEPQPKEQRALKKSTKIHENQGK